MKKMKKIPGNSIVEVLIALCVLGIVVPASFSAFGNTFLAGLKVRENAYMISSAEWWFSRLPSPVDKTDIDAAPKVDERGRARFEWETEDLDNGAISVTLRVIASALGSPFTIRRIH